MAPKKVNFTEDTFQHQKELEDDDCQSHVSCETEYTFETVQTGYTYETVYTEVTEPTEASDTTRVRFSPHIDIEETLPLDDYTAKERKAYWYSEEDKAKLNARRMKVVTRMEGGKTRRRKGETYRGLECSSMEGAQRLQAAVARHADAIMNEQDRQWKIFRDDYEMLAMMSRRTSAAGKLRAFELANLDAEAVVEEATAEDLSSSESRHSADIE
jgi:hypothetical protein